MSLRATMTLGKPENRVRRVELSCFGRAPAVVNRIMNIFP